MYYQCMPHTMQMPNQGVSDRHVSKPVCPWLTIWPEYCICHIVRYGWNRACLIPPKSVNKDFALWHGQLFQVPCEIVQKSMHAGCSAISKTTWAHATFREAATASLERVIGTQRQEKQEQDQTTLQLLQRPELNNRNRRSLSAGNKPHRQSQRLSISVPLFVLYW